ncbi:T9SS type A sorting domain-containing protein [Hymenobacter sp. ASUV-10]|uniref:T9SS type A sorting domain-containing protein n=1 Tax=Hymenobacter aranciens TaxID=3063996 RepID=A0ABT9BBY0_9BACT|nr:T9SS type A sorting domain-containing protein [Hymenobacter sp. ASUV-10]MDO7875775.1 T9SS type A sorting domain-containing protein [Hymenobacter sp. ASUV-10]
MNGVLNGSVYRDNGTGIPDELRTTYRLQAGAILEIAGTRGGLPFQYFTTFGIDQGVSYVFNGTAPQSTNPVLPGSPLQSLPSIITNLTINNPTTVTLAAPISVTGALRLQNGVFTLGGQRLTVISNAQRTGAILNTGGSLSGNTVTVQRYISPSLNAGVGYRHFSSPVQSAPINDLRTSSFTPVENVAYNSNPSVTPFPNVFAYSQSRVSSGNTVADFDRGWLSPASTTEPMQPGQGYTVNISGGQVVDFNGAPNAGTVVGQASYARGTGPQAGWHLLGNPYPSAISWTALPKTGFENAVYVFRSSGQYTGVYASYVNGVSNNGGSDTLALGQGFFARVSTPGGSGTLSFVDAARVVPATQPVFARPEDDERPLLTLGLRTGNATATSLQTSIYFENGATSGFDAAFDASALPSSIGLGLGTEVGNELLAINGQANLNGNDVLLPLRITAAATGAYSLTVDALRNLPTAYLRDAQTGSYTELTATTTVPVQAAAGRYAVLFTTQNRVLATAPQELVQLATLYPNPAHGTATLVLPAALRGAQATQVQVLDNLGRPVLSRSLTAAGAGTLELPLGQLVPGVYTVQARTAVGLVAKKLVVQ